MRSFCFALTSLLLGLRKVLSVSHDPRRGPLPVLVLALQPLQQLAARAAVAHRPGPVLLEAAQVRN